MTISYYLKHSSKIENSIELNTKQLIVFIAHLILDTQPIFNNRLYSTCRIFSNVSHLKVIIMFILQLIKRTFFVSSLLVLLVFINGCTSEALDDYAASFDNQPASAGSINPIYPAQGNSDIAVNLNAIRVTFSGIDGNSILAGDFAITPNINGNLDLISSTEINFIPTSSLQANTTYTITISDLTNTAGDPVDTHTWSFTTGNAAPLNRTTYFISPNGNDSNNGTSSSMPWKTFSHSFTYMLPGDELILKDGNYNLANNTGGIHYDSSAYPNSAQIPSGIDINNPTLIRAENPGNVFVEIPLFIGRSTRKDSFIQIQGITFKGGKLYNTSYITIKDTGFNNQFTIGTNDHDNGNTYNLIEDVWIWAEQQRIIALNYRSHNNIWRRVIVRGDGCNIDACLGSGNPNVGFTIYDSHDVSAQNVMVVDRILNGGRSYSDFASAQHTSDSQYYLGRNEWLGIAAVNSEDNALIFEADSVIPYEPTWTIKNYVALGGRKGGLDIGNMPYNIRNGANGGATPNVIENITITLNSSSTVDGIRLSPGQNNSTVRNVISHNAGRYGINSASQPNYAAVYSANTAEYNQTTCATGCYNNETTFEAAVPRPLIIDTGSPLKGAGSNGGDIGASIYFQYGTSGSRYGDANYNTMSSTPLWPWPNEARIKAEMCATTSRGFCENRNNLDNTTPLSLTSYIWELTGSEIPDSIYNP